MPQDPSRKRVTHSDKPNHQNGYLQFVCDEIRHRIGTVANGEIAHAKIAK